MISSITSGTVSTVSTASVTSTSSVVGISAACLLIMVVMLLIFLASKELFGAKRGYRRNMLTRALTVGIVPFVIVFALSISTQIVNILA
ncbi:hypothetical protein ACFLVL_01705 [Chloroflexota bacterium]